MKRLVGLLAIFLCVFACALGLYISAVNRDVVVIDLLFWPAVPVRSGLLVVVSLIAGALAGLMVGTLAGIGRRKERGPALGHSERTERR